MGWRIASDNGCPCKDCEDRIPGCHDRCCDFRDWKKAQEELKEAERKRVGVNTMSDSKKKALWKKQVRARRYGHGGIRDKSD